MRTLALLAACLLAVLMATDRAMAQTPSGWTQKFENGMRVARSYADASSAYVTVLVLPAQPKQGALKDWFETTVTGKLTAIGTILARVRPEPFQDWQHESYAVRDASGTLMVVSAYAYESDVGYHLSYVVFPYTIDSKDERVGGSVAYIVGVRALGTGARGVAPPKVTPAPATAVAPTKASPATPYQPRKCRTVTRTVDNSRYGTTCHGPYGSSSRYCYPTFTPGTRQVTEQVCD